MTARRTLGNGARAPDDADHHPAPAGEDHLAQALALAYRYLNRRERTVTEMRDHLAAHDVEPGVAGDAISTLCEQGYLDDARFARLLASDKRRLEQWGDGRIRRVLTERGIERSLVESSLHDPSEESEESELERAVAVLRRRFPAVPRDRRGRDRALGVMLRKGFDGELAVDALAAYARECAEIASAAPRYYDAGGERMAREGDENTSKPS